METKPEAGVAAEAANVLSECVKLANNIPSRKSKEQRRNEGKESEHISKFLNSNHTPEEKLAVVSKKYFEVADENRKNQVLCKQWEKKFILVQKERDQTQAEYNKTILVKSKLESLCRELQKQIKVVKEESLLKIKEEDEKHNNAFTIYKEAIKDLANFMEKNNERNVKLRDSNLDMKEKFKNVMEQYELREKHIEKITQQMQLEAQLAEAKLAKANLEAQAEREKLLAEKKQLLIDLQIYQGRCTELQATASTLHSQIAMYTDKYDEFQTLLSRSNEVFGGVKGEMEKVSQQVEKQEKEALVWKQRWEKSHNALLDMAAEKQKVDAAYGLQERQLSRLQGICRTLQTQRTALLATLKEHDIETPALTQAPPEPSDKVDVLSANCAELKQSLSQLQGQLNELTSTKKPNNTTTTSEIPANVNKKSKKGKAKKGKGTKDDDESKLQTASDSTEKLNKELQQLNVNDNVLSSNTEDCKQNQADSIISNGVDISHEEKRIECDSANLKMDSESSVMCEESKLTHLSEIATLPSDVPNSEHGSSANDAIVPKGVPNETSVALSSKALSDVCDATKLDSNCVEVPK